MAPDAFPWGKVDLAVLQINSVCNHLKAHSVQIWKVQKMAKKMTEPNGISSQPEAFRNFSEIKAGIFWNQVSAPDSSILSSMVSIESNVLFRKRSPHRVAMSGHPG